MTLDARARATTLRLLTKYGKTCTLNRIEEGVYDPATGSVTNTTTSYSVKAYLDQPNKVEIEGGQVDKTDEVAMFAALGLAIEPNNNDTLTVDSRNRTIKSVNRVWSGELVALWRCALAS